MPPPLPRAGLRDIAAVRHPPGDANATAAPPLQCNGL